MQHHDIHSITSAGSGEKGIRTLGTHSVQRFSRPPHSTTLASLLNLFTNKKQPNWVALCGDRGIRTPDTVLYNGFQDRRDRPLCHISAAKIQKFSMRQHFFQKFFILHDIFLIFVPDYEVCLSSYCLFSPPLSHRLSTEYIQIMCQRII